jgi:integral membrane sensor domain MASE1
MTPIFVLVVGCAVSLFVLAFVAVRYPRGRQDWGKDRAETLSLVGSLLTFVLLFLLLWYATSTLDWPSAVVITFWVAVCTVAALVIAALIYPEGMELKFGKREP